MKCRKLRKKMKYTKTADSTFLLQRNSREVDARKQLSAHSRVLPHNNIMPKAPETIHRQDRIEPPHDKTNKMSVRPAKTQISLGYPPSLIRVFVVRMKKAWVLSYPLSAKRRLKSDWADAQADLSLRWAHTHFVGFVMSQLTLS